MRVKEVLKQKGMTAKELAAKIGISEGALSQSIKEGANPNLQTLTKIATALNVPITELFSAGTNEELTALIQHKEDYYKATTIAELEKIVSKIKEKQ
ncbi:helix-turn-helix domain-containing protein [Paraprevotella xylaniphila]|uniref:helix-turn-helix domain-containing protein n=1 Tax=Paraprevotella xylaniphila TaxID=454155 RepID=UPI0010328CC4|nr:helix-turn-helix transcriptional regulator [Paraprevotella xylaniphila]